MKYLLSVLVCLCLSFSAKAQSTCHSMLEGNPEWSYYELYQGVKRVDGEPVYDYILTFYRFYLDGQKEINGKTYHCIYMQTKERDAEMTAPVYFYGVREEAGKVYADYNEFIRDKWFQGFMPYEITPDSEVVVYDFTKELNDKFYCYRVNAPSEGVITTTEIKSIEEIALNDGSKRNAWRMDDNGCYVEGIGSINSNGLLTHHLDLLLIVTNGYRWYNLNWFKQNGEYVYKAPDYTGDPSVEEESYTTFKKEDPFFKGESNDIDQSATETVKDGLRYVLLEGNIASVGATNEARETITSVVIPDSVEIGGVTVPVERIDGFFDCKELKSVVFPATAKEIFDFAFANCEKLESITMNNGLLSIEISAFEDCKSLESIEIPSTVSKIGLWVFKNCRKLSDIRIEEGNEIFEVADGILMGKVCHIVDGTETIGPDWNIIFCPATKTGEVVIGESITGIYDYAFNGCNGIDFKVDSGNKNFSLYDNALYDNRSNRLVACGRVKDGELTLKPGIIGIKYGALDDIEIETLVFPHDFTEYDESGSGYISSTDYELKPTGLKKIMASSIHTLRCYFEQEVYDNATLVIPSILEDRYMKYDRWNIFKNVEIVETDYALYPKDLVIAYHEDTKGHYFKQFRSYVTPKTEVLLSLKEKQPEYIAGDTALVTSVLANAWYEYMESGKSETYKARAGETVECKDGTIYLLDEIDDNDFMNFLLQRSITRVAEERSLFVENSITKNCSWSFIDCGEDYSTPNSKYMEFTPSTGLVQPSVGIDFSDMPLLANYPYEVTVVTIPDNSGKDYKVRVCHLGVNKNSSPTYFNNQDGKRDFIINGDISDTLKFELLKTEASQNIVIQIMTSVKSSELEEYTRSLRLASVTISPKNPADILPSGIEDVRTDGTSSNPADSAIYDLTGRRLNGKPERGIYIQGGKKYIIK